ncbi:hypothetical protein N0V90_000001 [Kalmusia sp. IMI 367209]|nr:hypothetical protein N0V90_000001 [Kalmusia sp. IMI 367209]
MPGSTPHSPIDCNVNFDPANVAGKTAIVTGGASGIGEAYVRALHAARAQIVIGDLNEQTGEKLASELPSVVFVKTDVTKWEDQLNLFQQAEKHYRQIHYVVANAGIATKDDVFAFDGRTGSLVISSRLTWALGANSIPAKPNLDMIDVNIRGSLYTAKLAMHYFIKLNGVSPSPHQVDTRVNVISPWYVRTNILTKETFDHVESTGVEMAAAEDAGQALLRLLSDVRINGRMLFISPRRWAVQGYVDLDIDEYPGDQFLKEIQDNQVKPTPVTLGLFIK